MLGLYAVPNSHQERKVDMGPKIVLPDKDEKIIFSTGDLVYFKSLANRNYLSWIDRKGGGQPVEAVKGEIDPYCEFLVTVSDDQRLILQVPAKKSENYVSRIDRGTDRQPIEATKAVVDDFCKFEVIQLSDEAHGIFFALQADNGRYLSVIDRRQEGLGEPIEADKSAIDDFCRFQLRRIV
jgi:hypothetical protein